MSSWRRISGEWSCMPSQATTACQTRVVNLHWKRRWEADSWTCLHRGQSPQFGHPHRCNRSVVHTRFWMISQVKTLHFGGAQFLQIVGAVGLRTRPSNCAMYAVAVEYSPLKVNFQEMVSFLSGLRATSVTNSHKTANSWICAKVSPCEMSICRTQKLLSRALQTKHALFYLPQALHSLAAKGIRTTSTDAVVHSST